MARFLEPTRSSSSEATDISVTCGVSTDNSSLSTKGGYFAGQPLYFSVINKEHVGDTYPITFFSGSTEISKGTLSAWSGVSSLPLGTLAAGTYGYSVYYNGKAICNAEVEVRNYLSCSVDSKEIFLGDSYTFNWAVASGADCWSCSFSDGIQTVGQIGRIDEALTGTPTSDGQKSLTVSCTCNNISASCSETVTVSEKAPAVSCPDAQTKSINSTVSLAPKSLTGCWNGCDYAVTDASGEVGHGTLNNGGKFSFASAANVGETSYTLKVSNSVGSGQCSFNVDFIAALPVTVEYQKYIAFEAGKEYDVTISGSQGGKFRCQMTESKPYSTPIGIFNGTELSFDENQNQATVPNPGAGSTVKFIVSDDAPSDLTCATDW